MPSRLVMDKFRSGKLRSGNKRTGPVVRNPAQARAIQISEARAEGHNIPERRKRHGKRHGKHRGVKRHAKRYSGGRSGRGRHSGRRG